MSPLRQSDSRFRFIERQRERFGMSPSAHLCPSSCQDADELLVVVLCAKTIPIETQKHEAGNVLNALNLFVSAQTALLDKDRDPLTGHVAKTRDAKNAGSFGAVLSFRFTSPLKITRTSLGEVASRHLPTLEVLSATRQLERRAGVRQE